jgi:hypothetical protein
LIDQNKNSSSSDNKQKYMWKAIRKILDQGILSTEVNATIWLAKGEHFFFMCENKTSTGVCSEEDLMFKLSNTDNVNFKFKAA